MPEVARVVGEADKQMRLAPKIQRSPEAQARGEAVLADLKRRLAEPGALDDCDDEFPFCDRCQNMGTIDCFCGGDMCICEWNGERPCPYCERGRQW